MGLQGEEYAVNFDNLELLKNQNLNSRDFSSKYVVNIIDDNEEILFSLRSLIEIYGFEARVYYSAEEFLANFPNLCEGCIVTDIRMTGMDGIQLAVELARLECSLPIVIFTAQDAAEWNARAADAGVLDIIEKPASAEVIITSIRTALKSRNFHENQRSTKIPVIRNSKN